VLAVPGRPQLRDRFGQYAENDGDDPEIKQAVRTIITGFDDWRELKGLGQDAQFCSTTLTPGAVDFKRLLAELYDRKLISRSSMLKYLTQTSKPPP
jgi:hypothetical protein